VHLSGTFLAGSIPFVRGRLEAQRVVAGGGPTGICTLPHTLEHPKRHGSESSPRFCREAWIARAHARSRALAAAGILTEVRRGIPPPCQPRRERPQIRLRMNCGRSPVSPVTTSYASRRALIFGFSEIPSTLARCTRERRCAPSSPQRRSPHVQSCFNSVGERPFGLSMPSSSASFDLAAALLESGRSTSIFINEKSHGPFSVRPPKERAFCASRSPATCKSALERYRAFSAAPLELADLVERPLVYVMNRDPDFRAQEKEGATIPAKGVTTRSVKRVSPAIQTGGPRNFLSHLMHSRMRPKMQLRQVHRATHPWLSEHTP